MKILRFEAENVKRLRVVQITPAGNIVEITGKNGAGKSSILDAIWYALGGAENIPSVPLRKGAAKGHVTLDLGEIVVTRKFSAGGSTELRVESQDGTRLKSPQQILDKLVGSLTFDPLEFSRMKPAEQLQQLRGLVKLDVDIDALDADNEANYKVRSDLNREAKSLTAQADGIIVPESTPEEETDVSALIQALQDASRINAAVEKAKADKQALENTVANLEAENKRHIEESKRIYGQARINLESKRLRAQQILADAKAEADRIIARASAEKGRLEVEADQALKDDDLRAAKLQDQAAIEARTAKEKREKLDQFAIPEPVDTAELSQKIQAANATNRFVERKKQKAELKQKAADTDKKASELTRTIDRREEQKREAIASAKMPIEGLSFGDGQVLFKGIPFDQASSAEQLRVSTAIAISTNPKLRVIRIQDGSLLDDGNMKTLAEMAEKNDQQIWVERVTGSGKTAIVIEAGEVVS